MSHTKKIPDREKATPSQDKDAKTKSPENPSPNPMFFDQTTEYIKDPKTGRWVIVNPAGSELYNNLYREKIKK